MDSEAQTRFFERLRTELLSNSRVTTLFMGNPKHAFMDTGFFYEDHHFLHFHPQSEGFQADLRLLAGGREEILKDARAQPHNLEVANETGWILYNLKSEEDFQPFLSIIRKMFEAAEQREPAEFRQLQP